MGLPVLILGESGTGKSASLRNFTNDDIALINVVGKPLPFKSDIKSFSTDDYTEVKRHLKELADEGCRRIVIDDVQYLMANEFMRRAMEKGYDKFMEMGQHYWSLIDSVKKLPDECIVYFLSHIEHKDDGTEKVKTVGKLLDEKITIEGMFTIVLKTSVQDGVYSFVTQNNGKDTVKTPMGMFETYGIENDLKYVDDKIREYYSFTDAPEKVVDKPTDAEPTKKKRVKRNEPKEEEPTEAPEKETKEEDATPKRKKREPKEGDYDWVEIPEGQKGDIPFFQDEEKVTEETTPRRRRRREQ